MENNQNTEEDQYTDEITAEEKFISILLTVGIPLGIALITFGSIALAFYQWKIY
ncbi:MAG: hypothetical protein ACQEP7_03575 [bacterium]